MAKNLSEQEHIIEFCQEFALILRGLTGKSQKADPVSLPMPVPAILSDDQTEQVEDERYKNG